MPIYDYTCGACGRVTEVIHGINDHGPRFCPECGAEGSMRKALSAPAVVFKGSGWAKVDRRSSSGGSHSSRSSTRKAGSGTDSASSGPAAGSASDGSATAGGAGGGSTAASEGGGD